MRTYSYFSPPATTALSHLPSLTQTLLLARGISTLAEAEQFLTPSYDEHLHDPRLLHQVDAAAARIAAAVATEEHIAIFSDYDCDGIPGAVVLHDYFVAIGYEHFQNYIPHRHYEGFGLSVSAVEKLAADGVTLIITIDCGTSDVAAVERARELGIDVIITDHHEPGDTLPPAVAVVNPKLGEYPFPDLCGAAVVFKLVQVLLATIPHQLLAGYEKWWLDMVGVATIADMVPLRGENRVLAHYGLMVLRKSRRPGLHHLLRQAKLSPQHLTEEDVGFTIGPRINAASRMDTPEDAFHMLAARDEVEAGARVAHLEKLNTERKSQVALMTKDVHQRLQVLEQIPPVLVLGNPSWRPSLVGLSANKLAEEHNRPVFLWGRDGNDVYKGSCRSGGSVSVVTLMNAVSEIFLEHGGHHFSGGFSVRAEFIHQVSERLNRAYEALGEAAAVVEVVQVDATLALEQVDEQLVRELATLAPFGAENPKPLFAFSGVTPERVEQFGKGREHLKLSFQTARGPREAIAFFATTDSFQTVPQVGESLTLLAHVEQSFFMNRPQIRLRIVDILANNVS